MDFALIGGVALAARGVLRATGDIDMLVDGERAADVDSVMRGLGYQTLHRSPDVAHYASAGCINVDVLYARRAPSRGMLARAERCALLGADAVRVVQPEDLIGLKVQASSNDPRRLTLDMADIERLMISAPGLDLDRVREYFRIFDRETELDALLARQR